MPYVFDHIFAADEANPQNVARNSSITLFLPGDATMTPVTGLTTVDGQPYPNPVTVNANGYAGQPVHDTIDRLAWSGGGFTGTMTAYEGMKEVAVASQLAAVNAASEAAAAAATVVTSAAVDGSGQLVLTKADDSTVIGGSVIGPAGPKGDKGADGSNVLPTDTAIKNAITTPGSETQVALSATYAGVKKFDNGGIFPLPFRAPCSAWKAPGRTFTAPTCRCGWPEPLCTLRAGIPPSVRPRTAVRRGPSAATTPGASVRTPRS